ncbi:DUF748 domain-containing protein [Rhodoferax saidenbachensis]|uniref:DUF748 domain-containing protein n=1 Tax=Rhodoferax saidenbachensis TaxID=1484693 RepID=A0ABU1ZJN0_9BURK|nr:DUF748 domain-containing protein [Rhodoferax saidenbachensis]MDR7305752.1 hypothetical protein [Rhodoferax saidenbachensis]
MTSFSPRTLTWLRRLAWTAAALVLLWVLAWLAVPPLLKSQAQTRLSALLGRTVTVGAVDFAPWSLELTLRDLAVAKADGSGPQFSVARIYVDAELQSVLRLAPVVDAVAVEGPTLQLTHLGDGRYDIDDILQRLSAPSDTPPGPLPRFAVYNVTLSGGSVDYADQSLQGQPRQHTLRDLQLSVPFLSNFDSQRDVLVSPRLAFVLNGSAFDTAAEGTPFAQARKGEAQIKVSQLDLKPYLAYLPASLPVKPQSAVVDAELKIGFVQTPQTAVSLSGVVTVSQLAVNDAAGAPLLAADTVRTELADVRPLEQIVKLSALTITNPRLQVVRARNGHLNLDLASATPAAVAPKKGAARADSTGATGQKDAQSPAAATPAPWTLQLEQLALTGGTVDWLDQRTQPAAKLALADVAFTAQSLQWPMDKPVTAEGSATLPGKGTSARLGFKLDGTLQQGSAQATVSDLPLALAAPYTAQFLEPGVRGLLDAQLGASWQGDQVKATAQRLVVRDAGLVASKPAAGDGTARGVNGPSSSDLPQFKLLEITDVQADPAARTARVGKVLLARASTGIRRDADGQWMFQSWLKPAATPAPAAPADKSAAPAVPWKVALGELSVQDASAVFSDRTHARPVRLELSALNLLVKDAQLDGKKPVPVTLSAHMKSGQAEAGSLRYQGTAAWDPVQAQGSVELLELPLHALVPYFAEQINLDVLRADASFKGQLRFASTPKGPEVALKGDAQLEDFRANTVQGPSGGIAEELLSWKALNVPGIDLAMVPGAATRVSVREAALSDFYARLIVSPTGRLNLQDLMKTPAQADAAASTGPAAPGPSAAPDAIVTMGPISVVNGKVLFSDRFIQPNYTADLSDLTGKLSQFSSQPSNGAVRLADLELRGRAEGTASLEITGKLNPLAKPLALDIAGKVRDLELPPLSPYAVKYAGYGIERGKLSVDVHYAVQPDGQLTASNKLVLNQLSFGDKVEGAPNSLPVKLAVALLADRNGVIDLDLPISGSLNDPQFRIGPVIWKVITNLVVKAITSPFSLLANALGGGGSAELSTVAFAPGSGALSDAARTGLDKVAKALVERPALKLTVVGQAQLEAEREAVKREKLKGLLLAEKRRRASGQGQDAAAVNSYTAEEMPVLLRAVYRRADITKPRNLVGLTKDIEVPDMEALLLANITVTDDTIRELALQRSVVVKDYLATQKVPTERLFLGAIKTTGHAADAKPQAELNLTMQ